MMIHHLRHTDHSLGHCTTVTIDEVLRVWGVLVRWPPNLITVYWHMTHISGHYSRGWCRYIHYTPVSDRAVGGYQPSLWPASDHQCRLIFWGTGAKDAVCIECDCYTSAAHDVTMMMDSSPRSVPFSHNPSRCTYHTSTSHTHQPAIMLPRLQHPAIDS